MTGWGDYNNILVWVYLQLLISNTGKPCIDLYYLRSVDWGSFQTQQYLLIATVDFLQCTAVASSFYWSVCCHPSSRFSSHFKGVSMIDEHLWSRRLLKNLEQKYKRSQTEIQKQLHVTCLLWIYWSVEAGGVCPAHALILSYHPSLLLISTSSKLTFNRFLLWWFSKCISNNWPVIIWHVQQFHKEDKDWKIWKHRFIKR